VVAAAVVVVAAAMHPNPAVRGVGARAPDPPDTWSTAAWTPQRPVRTYSGLANHQ
jgi:hypothetical protein